jgi:hypothetical protein
MQTFRESLHIAQEKTIKTQQPPFDHYSQPYATPELSDNISTPIS